MRLAFFLLLTVPLAAQSGATNGEWRTYGADLGNTHYSPLDQINATNFGKLQVAWRFKTENLGPTAETNLVATPLMAKGVVCMIMRHSASRQEATRRRHRRTAVGLQPERRHARIDFATQAFRPRPRLLPDRSALDQTVTSASFM